MAKETTIVAVERIQNSIYLIRKQRVMLDGDLAQLYGVQTRALVQAVKRNIKRFPSDFMFQLTKKEKQELITNCEDILSLKYSPSLPYVFTEQGVSMLSSVLRSKRAIEVNIAIMRTFVKLRQILATNDLLRRKIESMERKYDEQFQQVFAVLKNMLAKPEKPKPPAGYHTEAKGHEQKVKKKKAKGKKSSNKKKK